jgi:hypothetical protein
MKAEPLVEDIQNYALDIVDTVREPLLILDTTLRVRFANVVKRFSTGRSQHDDIAVVGFGRTE